MSLDATVQTTIEVPVGVSTIISPANANRISFTAQCRDIGTTWYVTLETLAAAEAVGYKFSGRKSFSLAGSVPASGNQTDKFEGQVNVFVTAQAGVATVGFWVVETEVIP